MQHFGHPYIQNMRDIGYDLHECSRPAFDSVVQEMLEGWPNLKTLTREASSLDLELDEVRVLYTYADASYAYDVLRILTAAAEWELQEARYAAWELQEDIRRNSSGFLKNMYV